MVLNGYNYHERSFKKGDLNNPFYKQKLSLKDMFHKKKKKQRENIYSRKEIMKKKVLERTKADVALSSALAETTVLY